MYHITKAMLMVKEINIPNLGKLIKNLQGKVVQMEQIMQIMQTMQTTLIKIQPI